MHRLGDWLQKRVRTWPVPASGYGLMLLMSFLFVTVGIGASLEANIGPMTAAMVGKTYMDSLSARQIANAGLDATIVDVQSKLNSLTTVDTSYRFPSSGTYTLQMPSDAANTGSSQVPVGVYYSTMTQARGNAYWIKTTATVGNATQEANKLVFMQRNVPSLDAVTAPAAAYGLRKLRNAYAGSAIRVRRASDNTEQDIGFNNNGDLDQDALTTFLGSKNMPLDDVTGAAAAYGLRRLRTGYTGPAIQVRRSSDNAVQDIGFDANNNLNTVALMDFVGSSSGYVTTMYDQSGNGRHIIQPTVASQPAIVNAGQLYFLNGRVSVMYDGVDDGLYLTGTNSGTYGTYGYTGITDNFTQLVLGRVSNSANTIPQWFKAINYYVYFGNGSATWPCMIGQRWLIGQAHNQAVGISLGSNGLEACEHTGGYLWPLSQATLNIGTQPVLVGLQYTSKQPSLYLNGGLKDVGLTSTLSSVSSVAWLGSGYYGYSFAGDIPEMMLYPSSLSNANRKIVENNMMRYYRMPANVDLGYVPSPTNPVYPLESVGLPSNQIAAAYGLRKLNPEYTGPAIAVRRSSDNTWNYINFDKDGNLDTTALMNFVGSGSGYIFVWYDQSGNNRYAYQNTNALQPRIVNNGVMDNINGRPAIQPLAGTMMETYLTVQQALASNQKNTTVMAAIDSPPTNTASALIDYGSTGGNCSWAVRYGIALPYGNGTTYFDVGHIGTPSCSNGGRAQGNLSWAGRSIASFIRNVDGLYIFKDSNLMVAASDLGAGPVTFDGNLRLFSGAGSDYPSVEPDTWQGKIGELIVYNKALGGNNFNKPLANMSAYYGTNGYTAQPVPPLLTAYVPAAYGLRRLSWFYYTNAIRVRRSSDNAEADIGFDANGNLNVPALVEFAGTGSAYVKTWYDQSLNGNDATQATAALQPRIVSNGVLDTFGGRPAMYIDGVDDELIAADPLLGDNNSDATINMVGNVWIGRGVDGSGNWSIGLSANSGTYVLGGGGQQYASSSGSGNGATTITFDQTPGVNTVTELFFNGVSGGAQTVNLSTFRSSTVGLTIGQLNNIQRVAGSLSEIIVFNKVITPYGRQALETSQMAYYNIGNLNPGDGYVTKWYDQSGNGKDMAQPNPILQPALSWDAMTNRPVPYFNGYYNYLDNRAMSITSSQTSALGVAKMVTPPDSAQRSPRVLSGWATGSRDFDNNSSAPFICGYPGSPGQIGGGRNQNFPFNSIPMDQTFQISALINGTSIQNFTNTSYSNSTTGGAGNLGVGNLRVGSSGQFTSNGYNEMWFGSIMELMLYPTALTTTQRQAIEREQRTYWDAP